LFTGLQASRTAASLAARPDRKLAERCEIETEHCPPSKFINCWLMTD
jgi:hypothetical protein